jgi:O-antigen/teichoic acid export membrane protein
MSTIRRQSIISSVIVYSGFALAALNTYLLTWDHGGFTMAQYGLTTLFMTIGTLMYSFANLGTQAFIYKFYPYYNDNLPPRKNDMMSWAFLVALLGFLLVIIAGICFKDFVILKFGANSADLIKYYNWVFPFGLGLTFYSLLEAFAWQLKRSILTNYLREFQFRLFTTLLLVLTLTGVLHNFDSFIKIYSFSYILLALVLLAILLKSRQIFFPLSVSRVTKKFLPKILTQVSLVWGGGLVYNISFFFAQLVIAAVVPDGLTFVAVYSLAQYIASLIQAPQRVIISASIGPLSRAWKDKDYGKINHIYQRSSINQLIFSIGMFTLLWINFTDGVLTFHLKSDFLNAREVFLFIGLTRIIDMGTGVNSQIIGTSSFWRFDFFTGLILAAITLPLNYILAKEQGVVGPAIADLITFAVYNGIRFLFLYRKFDMQPFSLKTLYTVIIGLAAFLAAHYLFSTWHGIIGMFARSISFLTIYVAGVLGLRLSADVLPVWFTILKRLHLRK